MVASRARYLLIARRGGGGSRARASRSELVALLGDREGFQEASGAAVQRVAGNGPRQPLAARVAPGVDVGKVRASRYTGRRAGPWGLRADGEGDGAEGIAAFAADPTAKRPGHGAIARRIGSCDVSSVGLAAADRVAHAVADASGGESFAHGDTLRKVRVLCKRSRAAREGELAVSRTGSRRRILGRWWRGDAPVEPGAVAWGATVRGERVPGGGRPAGAERARDGER
jgi:hypothetical protein